ncbi:MAG: hypothetical protein FJ088_09445 [Deltaproteobacteria bacterium]|nr:hypothetical protein [Deltaproteobacteria bacterium]
MKKSFFTLFYASIFLAVRLANAQEVTPEHLPEQGFVDKTLADETAWKHNLGLGASISFTDNKNYVGQVNGSS